MRMTIVVGLLIASLTLTHGHARTLPPRACRSLRRRYQGRQTRASTL
jgi:hypothetical protein